MQSLSGSADWRPFTLPFFGAEGRRPTRMEVNRCCPGGAWSSDGSRSSSSRIRRAAAPIPGAWWEEQTGGLVGAVLGSGVGVLGAAIGTLSARPCRRLVTALIVAAIALGGLAAAAGIAALVSNQPYAVTIRSFLAEVSRWR